MDNIQWNNATLFIREQLQNDDIYDTWFSGVECERYDESTNTLTLRVPNAYIYKCLEHFCLRILSQALERAYQPGVHLQYRIAQKEPSFSDVADYLQQFGYRPKVNNRRISIMDARKRMEDGLRYFLGEGKYKWLPAYDRIADWLSDNKGRGLLCIGTSGLGKTLICEKILPVILGNGGRPIASVKATELHDRLPELMKERIVIIDDLGKEPAKHYGDIDRSFFELCSNAERTGQLLIITTNLATARPASWPADRPWPWPDSIEHRYGQEVLDRLKVITSVVRIEGESMRK